MDVWLSYRPGDFLMFSSRVYWQLVTANNQTFWPLPVLAVAAGLFLLWWLLRPGVAVVRAALILVGLAWCFVTWAFIWVQYSGINWAANWAIAPFLLQAALLVAAGMRLWNPSPRRPHRLLISGILVLYGTLLHPLGFLLDERDIQAADTWLMMPEPLAVTTAGLVLGLFRGWHLAVLLPIPLLWCLPGGAILVGLGSVTGWAVLAVIPLTLLGWLPLSAESGRRRKT